MAHATVTARNSHHAPVEVAGARWPARAVATRTIAEHRLPEVEASRHLQPKQPDRLDSLTVVQLREQLAAAGLDTGGLKADLVARLRAAQPTDS